MAYTATLTALTRVRDQWRFSILYEDTDSGQSLEKHYRQNSVTKKQLRDLARNEAVALLSNETTDVDVPIGTTIDVTPDPVVPPPDPTPEELARRAWFDDYRRLQSLLEVTGAVPALETAQATTLIASLRASLEAGWLNSYLDNI